MLLAVRLPRNRLDRKLSCVCWCGVDVEEEQTHIAFCVQKGGDVEERLCCFYQHSTPLINKQARNTRKLRGSAVEILRHCSRVRRRKVSVSTYNSLPGNTLLYLQAGRSLRKTSTPAPPPRKEGCQAAVRLVTRIQLISSVSRPDRSVIFVGQNFSGHSCMHGAAHRGSSVSCLNCLRARGRRRRFSMPVLHLHCCVLGLVRFSSMFRY